jgi:lactate permease
MASSFQALMAATGLPGEELAPWSSAFLGVACFGCGIAAAWVFEGRRSLRRGWPALLVIGLVMSVVQTILAASGLWNLAAFGAGLAGLIAGTLIARLPRYQQRASAPSGSAGDAQAGVSTEDADGRKPLSLGMALAPYLLLIVVVSAAELWPWMHKVLNEIQIQLSFPEVQTSYGWTTAAGTGRTISVFGHGGALLAYVALAFCAVYSWTGHYSAGVGRRIVQRTIKSAVPSSIGIATMVGMAVAMDHAGMTYVLAEGLGDAAGPLYPMVAPFVGALGAFMTGSNTNSNVVFASLQQQAAQLLGISVTVILAAQTTGGALGSMLAPAKLIVGCSTAGLAGQEGAVLKKALVPGLSIAAVVGLLAWLAIALGVGGS